MSSISDLMNREGVNISIDQMRKDLGLRRKHYTPLKEYRDIEVNPETKEILSVAKVRVYKPKHYDEPIVESAKNISTERVIPVVIKEYDHCTNRCRCGCLLREHELTEDGKMACRHKHRPKCEDYGRN